MKTSILISDKGYPKFETDQFDKPELAHIGFKGSKEAEADT